MKKNPSAACHAVDNTADYTPPIIDISDITVEAGVLLSDLDDLITEPI